MLPFPEVRVADPVRHEALAVFPLFAESKHSVDYLLSDEAISGGSVTVEEIGEAGSVPNLLVDNRADSLVLFLEGEELRGAKQNRVLNTSVLAAANTKTTIPVSCVEQGRWRYLSRHFGSGGSHASSKLRHVLKKSVSQSAREGRGHGSNQGEVWKEVGRQMESLGSHSATGAMADTYKANQVGKCGIGFFRVWCWMPWKPCLSGNRLVGRWKRCCYPCGKLRGSKLRLSALVKSSGRI